MAAARDKEEVKLLDKLSNFVDEIKAKFERESSGNDVTTDDHETKPGSTEEGGERKLLDKLLNFVDEIKAKLDKNSNGNDVTSNDSQKKTGSAAGKGDGSAKSTADGFKLSRAA